MEIENERNNQENQKLLQAIMALLNLSVLVTTAFIGWSIYSLIVRAESILNIITGNFLR